MDVTDDSMMDESWKKEKQHRKLARAIKELDRKLARKLIIDEDVKPVNVEGEDLIRFLELAVESRDPHLVRRLLEQKGQLNTLENIGMDLGRILWIVAEDGGDTEIAEMLILAGADVNVLKPNDECGRSFLHVLMESDNPKKHQLAMLMMYYGADVDYADECGDIPLDYAVDKSSFELVEALIMYDVKIDELAIQAAAYNAKATKLLPILIQGDIINATTRNEKISATLLHLCPVDLDESHIFPIVLALTDIEFPEDILVVFAAVFFNRIKMVEFLLNNGVGISMTSVLLLIAAALKKSSITKLLIRKGADVNYCSNIEEFEYKQYPIHIACTSGSVENIKLLLRFGSDINVTNLDGSTPFSLIKDKSLNNVNRIVIKHIATLITKGLAVNEADMEFIHSRADLLKFYEECLKELHEMKRKKIFNHISLYSLLINNVKQLSWLTRNCSLVDNYNKVDCQILFPLYHTDLEWKFKVSEKRKKLLTPQEKVTYEVFNKLLPNLVVEKIILYLYCSTVKAF